MTFEAARRRAVVLFSLILATFAGGCGSGSTAPRPVSRFAYVANAGNSVSAYRIDASSGFLTQLMCTGGACSGDDYTAGVSPSAIAVDPAGKFVYVVNQYSESVSAWSINAGTGALTPVPGSPFLATWIPKSIVVHPSGMFAYVANINSANVVAYGINGFTGALTGLFAVPTTGSQQARSVTIGPSGRLAFGVDLSSGALTAVAGGVVAFGGDAPSNLAIVPSGKFAMAADMNAELVQGFAVDAATGILTPVATAQQATGRAPTMVTIDPSGGFAYAVNGLDGVGGNSVSAYAINATTGALTAVAGSPFATGRGPTSLTFDPSGKFAYVTNGLGSISAYTLNASSGALTHVACVGAPCVGTDFPGFSPVSMATVAKVQ
jgi:6-phosphogluconolactonase